MKKNLWVFGDSWAQGWNLGKKDRTFAQHLNKRLKVNLYNRGRLGSSLGLILNFITKDLPNFKKGDLVFVIIPPDVRWYVKRYTDDEFQAIGRDHDEYEKYIEIMKLDNEWFRYHHNLFIYTIQKLLTDVEVKFVLAHNYGQIELLPEFENLIDKNLFLDFDRSLMKILSGKDLGFKTYNKDLEDGPEVFNNHKYFLENDNHPNNLGHSTIADLLQNKLNQLYNRGN